MILAAIVAIITDLQEERALVAPYVIEHVGDKVAGDGDQGDEVAFARRLAAFDTLIHGLISGHVAGQVMRRIATPMVGGMVSVTILSLLALPALYCLVHELRMKYGTKEEYSTDGGNSGQI